MKRCALVRGLAAQQNDETLGGILPSGLSMRVTRIASLLFLAVTWASPVIAQDTIFAGSGGAPAWGQSPRLIEGLRVGSIDGAPEYLFGMVGGLVVTAAGELWVGDVLAGLIRRYSPDGVHLGDVGRKGQGPGEFSEIHGLRLLRDGAVAVWDPLNARVHLFEATGQYRTAFRTPTATFASATGLPPLEADTLGVIYVLSITPSARPGQSSTVSWIRIGPDGAVRDTLVHPPTNRVGLADPTLTRLGISPHGYSITGRNDEYALHRPLPDGRTLRIERPFEPVAYERAERREKQAVEDRLAERNDLAPRRVPPNKPVWKSVFIAADGRLWVERYVQGVEVQETEEHRQLRLRFGNPERTWAEPLAFDVLDPRGRFLGTVRFPESASLGRARVELHAASGNHIWVLERGEFDEEYIVRYRIDSGG